MELVALVPFLCYLAEVFDWDVCQWLQRWLSSISMKELNDSEEFSIEEMLKHRR